MKAQFSDMYRKPPGKTYFLSHSVGLMPSASESILKTNFLDTWHYQGDNIWPSWLVNIEEFKTALAELLMTESRAFCPQTNVSSGLTKVIGALPKRSGKKTLLISENDFPSTSFVLQQATKLGYRIKHLPKHLDHQDANVWAEWMTEDVGSVFITHVHYNSNQLIPVSEIATVARQKGIFTLVDIAQSAGIVPIDLSSWPVDVVLGSCIKWLCGGPGAGFLWVNQALIERLEPMDVGWFSHQNPFEFDAKHFAYAQDSQRFWGGTPSILPYVVATHSIRQQLTFGVDAIRQHNQALCERITQYVSSQCLVSPVDKERRGGTLVLSFEKQELLAEKLSDAGILCDSREYGIRISPHIYNSEDDVEKLIHQLPKR